MCKKNKKLYFLPILLLLSTSLLFGLTGEVIPLASQSVLNIIFGAFLAGLLLTFTPCVLPMIPILSSIIVGQGKISKTKSVTLSAFYVFGTMVSYALMGALAGATGDQLQSYFQNVWAVGTIVIVFLIMSLSMFGLFNIQLPTFIQSKLNSKSQNIKGGSGWMVFILGMVSALIIGACVSPILISFLSIAISNADPMLGALTMFFMALGMGVPLIILGFGAGHLLPKAGIWMDKVKYFFGVMLLAVAIYIFNTLNLLPTLLPWGILFIIVSIYLGAIQPLKDNVNGWIKLLKGIGVILLIWGTFLLIGASYGENDLLRPLPKASVSYLENKSSINTSTTINPIPFLTIKSLDELETTQKEAKNSHKLLIVFFYTDWCPVCKRLKETTFLDSEVQKQLRKNYIAIKVNMTDEEDTKSQAIKKRFKIYGPPAFVFFDTEGKELKDNSFYGYQSPEEFLDTIELLAE